MGTILRWSARFIFVFAMTLAAAGQQFSDATFNNASWQTILLPSSASGAQCTAGLDSTNGNAAPSRKTTHIYPPGWVNCAHLSTPSTYDPSQGAIISLTYSYDLLHYTAKLGGVRYVPLVFQDNTYYIAAGHAATSATAWQSFSGALTQTSFTKLDGPSPRDTPDFSCEGSLIQFGYVTRNHLPSGSNITTNSAIDNWTITIERAEPCAVTLNCPPGQVETTVNGQTYCCPRDIPPQTPRFCCTPACPPGSQPTTINGVTFCCQIGPAGELCCTPP